jgi:hypothetical protein
LPPVDPVQFNLVETRIARYGSVMSIRLGGEVKMGLAGHDDMHFMLQGCDGEFVGWIQGRLRGDELPGTNAGIGGSRLNGGEQ